MELEDVSEDLEWEARRVATAFGLDKWSQITPGFSDAFATFDGEATGILVDWGIERATGRLDYFTVARDVTDLFQFINWGPNDWRFSEECCGTSTPNIKQLVARGLYCLGVEDEAVLYQLNQPITSHEKIELRLSMPREFWPRTWLERIG